MLINLTGFAKDEMYNWLMDEMWISDLLNTATQCWNRGVTHCKLTQHSRKPECYPLSKTRCCVEYDCSLITFYLHIRLKSSLFRLLLVHVENLGIVSFCKIDSNTVVDCVTGVAVVTAESPYQSIEGLHPVLNLPIPIYTPGWREVLWE